MGNVRIKGVRFLIVAGTGKSATTSLFHYLSDHPEVCPSTVKEIRFFLDSDYPGKRIYDYRDGPDQYLRSFPGSKDKLYLDISPQYLYSKGTSRRLKEYLEDFVVIFLLREPVSRLLSWYKFDIQTGEIDPNITLESYINLQIREDGESFHRKTLEQGRYSCFLKNYYEALGPEKIRVYFFEDINRNPLTVVKEICRFAGIDPEFFNSYAFKVHNKTEVMKFIELHHVLIKLREYIYTVTVGRPQINSAIRKIWNVAKPYYMRLNSKNSDEIIISPRINQSLIDYYKDEATLLSEIIGKKVPW